MACKVGNVVKPLWMTFYYSPHLKDHTWKIKRFTKSIIKMDLKYPQRNVSYLGQNCNIWVTQFL